jgi:class 3 adenylate cyclase/GAF domain-containing protein
MITSELQPQVDRLLENVPGHEERQRLVTYLRRYISPAVALRLLRQDQLVALLDQSLLDKVTVLFVDIRDFVKTVEEIERQNQDLSLVRSMLLDFANTVTDVIFKHEGISGEFAGDRMMAVFGVPTPCPDNTIRALKAAVELHIAFAELYERWQQERYKLPRLRIGIGIHTGGPVLVGDIGSKWRRELSVIGMTANIASRLEELTKREPIFKGQELKIAVSEDVYRETKTMADFSEPIERTLYGVSRPVTFRRVLGLKPGLELQDEVKSEAAHRQAYEQVEAVAELIEIAAQRERTLQVSQALKEIGETFTSQKKVLQTVIEQVQVLLEARTASLLLLEGQELRFAYVVPEKSERALLNKHIPKDKGFVGQVLMTGEPLILYDMPREDEQSVHLDRFDKATEFRPASMLCVPLRARERVIGAIQVLDEQPHRFDQESLNLLIFIAAQAAVAIDNARLREELRNIGEVVTSSLEQDYILDRIMESTQRLLGADRASLYLIVDRAPQTTTAPVGGESLNALLAEVDGQPERKKQLVFASVVPHDAQTVLLGKRIDIDTGIVGQVILTGRPRILRDMPVEDKEGQHAKEFDDITRFRPRSMLCVPLSVIDRVADKVRVIGAIQVLDNRPERFTEEDLDALVSIAAQAAVAIENVRQYQELERSYKQLEEARERERAAQERQARLEQFVGMADVATNLVHKINNQVGLIPVMISKMKRRRAKGTLDEKDIWETLDAIVERAENTLGLAQNVNKPFERIRTEPIDVNESLQRVLGVIQKPPDVNIALGEEPAAPKVEATLQLDEVFDHLVQNALDVLAQYKTTHEKRIEVQVLWPGENRVEVLVSDSGPGFPRDREPFLLGSSTKEKGLGFSLWWSRLYLRRINGDIELVDTDKPGCTFKVSVPVSLG